MSQDIEFNCRKCDGTALYEPYGVVVFKMAGRVGEDKPPIITASGRIANVNLKCDKNRHPGRYKIVKFRCKRKGCNEIVVATAETAPVYIGNDRRVINGKVTLTCDNGHTYKYTVR